MEGFFTRDETAGYSKKNKLPPVLKIKVPETKPKDKKDIVPPNYQQMFLDVECYPNYFLIKFLCLQTSKFFSFDKRNDSPLDWRGVLDVLNEYEVITFNGNKYDIPIVKLALMGATNKELKQATNELIGNEGSISKFIENRNLPDTEIDHIDLIEIAPSFVSLKIYGGRLHHRRLQDLPIEESAVLTEEEMDEVDNYCGNDLRVTRLLYLNLLEQIELRRVMSKQYGLELLSKSDAQIAEEVIKSEIYKIKGQQLKRPEIKGGTFRYKTPSFIRFESPVLQEALDVVEKGRFIVKDNGRISMPDELSKLRINIGKSTYNMGIGGLHSMEKSSFHVADEDVDIYDWDVDSYYPRIILNCGLYPRSIGEGFLDVYSKIVTERLEAKAKGDKVKADSLKICVNGSFGKLGSPYSVLYSPELMIQVTVTGQLSLLMLIEQMEEYGLSVVSGNTDGIVLLCPKGKEKRMYRVIRKWEERTGFTMSKAKYAGIYSRDVNNYIAIKEDGSVKTKGTFSPPSISKNPENEICSIAIIEYLKFGTPFKETICSCEDISKFITLRSVNGGAVKDGEYIGKAIRWYHSKSVNGSINYKTNGNQVPMTDGARPIMNMGGKFPDDVDYNWYVDKCYKMFF